MATERSGARPRFATPRNPDRRTLGPEVAEDMRLLGEPAMPWQADALDLAYELDEDATEAASSAAGTFQPRLWYREVRITVPRQSGKTTKAKARHAHRMRKSRDYGWARRPLSFYMAQTATDARDKMVEEWMPAFEECEAFYREDDNGKPAEDSPIQQFIRSNGREAIRWLGGGRITVKPPSRTGGHGGTPDLIDLDEAFAHRDGTAEQGVRPGLITKVSPQLYVVSTAGTAESEYLWGKVDDGRARVMSGDHGRVAFIEYSAPEDRHDYDNPALWHECMPALGYTQTEEAVRAEWDAMKASPDEFRRAYLNQWTSSVKRIIPAAAWVRCMDRASQVEGALVLAVDASPGLEEGRTAAIAVAGYRADGRIHGEVLEHAAGLSWVADSIGKLTRKHRNIARVYMDLTGPIRAIEHDIRAAASCAVEAIDQHTMVAACQRFHEDVLEGETFRHIGQDELDTAVDGAAKRTLGDSWAWARRTSVSDICPLVAVTEAYWGAVNAPRTTGIM